MTLADFLIISLAANSLVEIIRHAPFLEERRLYWQTTPFFFSRLLRCGYCSSYWAAWVVVGLSLPHTVELIYRNVPPVLIFISWLFYFVFCVLAIARAAQLLNSLDGLLRHSQKEDSNAGEQKQRV